MTARQWVGTLATMAASVLLAFAGGAKLWSEGGASPLPLMNHAVVRSVTAVAELTVALWLASGIAHGLASRVAAAMLFVFCAVACWLATVGATSCGCFGGLQVSPVWMVGADAVLGGALLIGSRPPRWGNRIMGGTAIIAFVAAMVLPAGESGAIEWLRPEDWAGRALPILDDIVADADVRHGAWTIVFYRSSCHECLERAEQYRERSRRERVLFIHMPPGTARDAFRERIGAGRFGVMNERRLWFLQTPAVVELVDGVVLRR